MLDVLYFGCIDGPGHYLWQSLNGYPSRFAMQDPRNRLLHKLDGLLCPADTTEGVVLKHFIHGHTVVAFWDRSVDSRPGSSSSFFLEGAHSYQYVIAAARQAFPKVLARIEGRFSLRLSEDKRPQ